MTVHQATQYFLAQGSSPAQAAGQAIAWIGQEIVLQASYLAYSDVFWTLMLVALGAVPLAMTLPQGEARRRRPGGARQARVIPVFRRSGSFGSLIRRISSLFGRAGSFVGTA